MTNVIMGFSSAQLAIAVIVSIVGTLMLSSAVFTLILRKRRQKQETRIESLKLGMARPDNIDKSVGSGDVVRSNGMNQVHQVESRTPRLSTPDWPLSSRTVSPISTISPVNRQQARSPGPLTSNSVIVVHDTFPPSPLTQSPASTAPGLSLFPRIDESQMRSPQRENWADNNSPYVR